MKHGSLFSGIGGFDLAAEWMGWENVFHCEIDEFPRKILNYYWPNSISYHDIKTTDFSVHRGQIDILTGGFPCQPYSAAGKRLGKEDDRHLWPFMLDAIRSIQPRWVVGENVRGLVNWSDGLVFEEVQVDLEAEGYEVQAFILPAAGIGAPHRRDRVWFVAYANHGDDRRNTGKNERESGEERISEWDEVRKFTESGEVFGDVADSNKRTKRPPGPSGKTESHGSEDNDEQGSRRRPTEQHIRCGELLRDVTDSKNIRWDCGKCEHREDFNQNREWVCKCRQERSKMGAITQRFSTESDVTEPDNKRLERQTSKRIQTRQRGNCRIQNDKFTWYSGENGVELHAPDTASFGRGQVGGQRESRFFNKTCEVGNWENFPTQSPICGGDDEFPPELDGITFSKWRNGSIKGYGNAVVPALVYEIFKSIEEYELLK